MSLSNSITKLLNIEDSNLKFNENFLEERIIKGKRCLVINGYLSNSFNSCPKCDCNHERDYNAANNILDKGLEILFA